MRIHRLSLRNFMGVRSLDLEPEGESLAIYGRNGTGKTTIASAWSWLLSGKDSSGRSDFAVKTLTPTGEPHHGLDHEVEAEIGLDGGRRMKLRRVYHETWTKRRGEAERRLTGHTTEYYIDGVPRQKKEYEAEVAALAEEEQFRLLTDPLYFPERLPWKKRREILLKACGDVTDGEVISADEKLADLREILDERSLDDHRRVLAARRAEINKELERLPVRIDEVNKGLPELPSEGAEALRSRANELRAQRRSLEAERSRIESGGEAAERRRRLAEVESRLQEIEHLFKANREHGLEGLRSKLSAQRAELDEASRRANGARTVIRAYAQEAEALERRMDAERTRFNALNAEEFHHEDKETCAACGQALPVEKVEAARQAALEAFNEDKSRRLREIREEGQRLKSRREEALSAKEQKASELAAAQEEVERLESEISETQAELERRQGAELNLHSDPEYGILSGERSDLGGALERLKEDSAGQIKAVEDQAVAVEEEITAAESSLALFDQHARGKARIGELGERERALAEEFEDLERQLFLTEEFTRKKVGLLEERINSRFEIARFQLFRVLVNGGLEECCEVTVDGVPYSSGLNHGSRIAVGLGIIRTLQEHFDFSPTVFVDQAESFTELPEVDGQMVRLIVSAADKELRVERVERA